MKEIPMTTMYRITKNGTDSFKVPKYELSTTEEIKAKQDKLGKNAGWYYGTNCKKCCDVFPAFFNEDGFENLGYYVCLVCGKESKHEPMPWQAKDRWNAGEYEWIPEDDKQLSIFDLLEVTNG